MDAGERTQRGVRVLGDLGVAGPGARPIGGPTQRRAFVVLVAHRNQTTTIDQLVEACWPGGDAPKRAEHNARTYVHRLRTALGEHDDRIASPPWSCTTIRTSRSRLRTPMS